MTPQELWNEYKKSHPVTEDEPDAWAFGAEPDLLADLVVRGIKTATASAYDEHIYYKEPLGKVGEKSIVLDSHGNAICIIETTRIRVVPFKEVSAAHAYLEGEGDRSLIYWRQVHEELFTKWLADIGITFTPDSQVVLEEFQVIYKPSEV